MTVNSLATSRSWQLNETAHFAITLISAIVQIAWEALLSLASYFFSIPAQEMTLDAAPYYSTAQGAEEADSVAETEPVRPEVRFLPPTHLNRETSAFLVDAGVLREKPITILSYGKK